MHAFAAPARRDQRAQDERVADADDDHGGGEERRGEQGEVQRVEAKVKPARDQSHDPDRDHPDRPGSQTLHPAVENGPYHRHVGIQADARHQEGSSAYIEGVHHVGEGVHQPDIKFELIHDADRQEE